KVEEAVPIIVKKTGASAPPSVPADPGPLRDIAERSVAIIVEQLIGGCEVGDEHVQETVVIVIHNCPAHTVSVATKSGLFCDFLEPDRTRAAVAHDQLIVEQVSRTRRFALAGLGLSQACAVQDQDVRATVIVVIKYCDARTDNFGKIIFALHAIGVHEMNAAGFSRINKDVRSCCPRKSAIEFKYRAETRDYDEEANNNPNSCGMTRGSKGFSHLDCKSH